MKIIISFAILTCCYIGSLEAQDPRKIPLVYQMNGMANVTSEKIIFKSVNDTQLYLEIYYPETFDKSSKLPVVIFNNGVGSFDIPEWKPYIDWAKLAASSGIIAVLYQSLPDQSLKISEDLIDYIRQNSNNLHIDENRIGLFTSSANVNDGLPLAFQKEREYIRCAVIYYGMAGEFQSHINKRQDLKLMIVRAGKDNYQLNNNIDNFIKAVLDADMNLEVINYLEGQHAFDIFDDNDRSRQIIKQTIEFYKYNLFQNYDGQSDFILTPKNLYQMIIKENKIDETLSLYKEAIFKYKNDSTYNRFYNHVIDENNLTQIGYELLNQKKYDEALKVFQANAEAYPESPNVYDCLADGYEKQGKFDMAIQYAQRTLSILPEADLNEEFKQMIKQSAEDKLRRLK